MKKKASELKEGNKIRILDKIWIVISMELSDIGKQGSKKCRLGLESKGEKMFIIRPADYPFNVEE